MNRKLQLGISVMTIIVLSSCNSDSIKKKSSNMDSNVENAVLNYPKTAKGETVDDYFGVPVKDPYRWLEDAQSEATSKWVSSQNETTFSYLENIPFRNALKERLKRIWNYERFGTPFKEGDYYYFFRNSGLQNQSVMYRQKDLSSEPELVIDPNTFSEDGTTALSGRGFSKDGKYMAYGLSEGGSDWKTIKVMDLDSKKVLSDEVKWMKFSGISWYKDGFYYSRYDKPAEGSDEYSQKNEFHKVYYHKLGTAQSEDKLIYQDTDNGNRNFNAWLTEDQRFLMIYASESTSGNALFYKDLVKGETKFSPLITTFDHDNWIIDNQEGKLLLLTNDGAPNKRLVLVDPKNPSKSNWKTIIPESENALESIRTIGGKLVVNYIKDAASMVKVFNTNGKEVREVKLPGIGTSGSFSGKKKEDLCFFNFTSYNFPNTIYSYDIKTSEMKVFKSPQVKFDSEKFETKRIFYKSKDGAKIPMYITYKKGLDLNGNNPTWLYGYGGFNISIKPGFNTKNILWLENGGVYAVANIRGGGEYGEKWHKAGTKLQKQNVFDDFIAAAEYLIDKGYTSSGKLAIEGRSNGGLLVGACMTQRPDLFKVALPAVGVLDMLRYHQFTIGRAWATDYGVSEDSIQFKNLLGYSPVHNIKEGVAYPATMVTTADHDDRVVPAHSYKFISTLQENHEGINPVLIRVETSAGHGAGKSTEKRIEEIADIMSFTLYNMGEDFPLEEKD